MRNNYFLPPKKLLKELGSLPCFRMPPKIRGKMEFPAVKRQSGLQCKIRYSQHTQKHRATDPILQGLKQADRLLQIQGQLGLQHGFEASLGCLSKILSQKNNNNNNNQNKQKNLEQGPMAQFWNPNLMSLKLKIQDQLQILNKSCLKK